MSNKTLEMTLLFDFFGDLLTEKQRNYFDLYYNDDLSLSEIAEQDGISRQGVRDTIMRAENALSEYESKTGVVDKFEKMLSEVKSLEDIANKIISVSSDKMVLALAQEMLIKLHQLKG